jgi:hypothetical protein
MNIRFIAILTLCIAVASCKGEYTEQFVEDEFIGEEFIVQSADFVEKFGTVKFLSPLQVESSDEAVATVALKEDALIVTSRKQGSATITISDWRCKSNAARIEVRVSETGGITTEVHAFNGNLIKAVVKEAVTIAGQVGEEAAPRDVKLMMDGVDFVGIAAGDDVSTWINNLPAGLTAEVGYVQAGEHIHEVTFTVSGTPTAASAEPLSITISSGNVASNVSVNVDPRPDTKFVVSE